MSKVYVVNIHSDNTKLYGFIGDRMVRAYSEESAAFVFAKNLMNNKRTDERVFIEYYIGATGEFVNQYNEYAIEKYAETLYTNETSQTSTIAPIGDSIVDSAESNTDTVAKTSTCSDCVSYVSMSGSPYCRLYGRSVSGTETCNFKVLKG